ncbi:hypothetical protein EDB80DRAFT_763584 [Ilyonectria destructans]|nr:hypothetical protein EDB80DRAFT_763584 [Ilyonectria destructans]
MTYHSSHHLQIINTVPYGTGAFTQFTRLPLELRSVIWEQSLCHERLIRVELWPGSSPEHLYEDQERTVRDQAKASLQLSETFLIVLRNRHEISKLLRVCSESRQAALRFYRVQVPCYYKQLGSPPIEGTFYFHPELDILDISGQNFFARFSHMLWAHDPRRVGLVNLGLAKSGPKGYYDKLFKQKKDEDLLRQALSRLRCVIFGYDGQLGRGIPDISTTCGSFKKSQILRSRPLQASVSKFQRLPRDPRSIETELKKVFMGFGDPRDQIYRWFRLLEKWQIEYHNYSVERVENREEAFLALWEEEKDWKRWRKTCAEEGTACEDDDQALPSAYGFWLFPIDAFGPIPSASQQIRKTGRARIRDWPRVWDLFKAWDLSEHKPELCLQYLPEAQSSSEVAVLPKGLEDEGPLLSRPKRLKSSKRPAKKEWRACSLRMSRRGGYSVRS